MEREPRHARDRLAVDGDDDVLDLQPGLRGGAAGLDGAAAAFGCSNAVTSPTTTASTTTDPTSTNASCAVTPTETAGPFPSVTSVFRSDIREDRAGIALTLTITVVSTNGDVPGVNF